MDLDIPAELRAAQQAARDFVTQLLPLERQIEEQPDLARATLRSLRKSAVEQGIYGYNLPAELGGGGLGPLGQALIAEEAGRTSIPLGDTLGRLPQWLMFCRGDQVDWLLRPALRADVVLCSAMTEPQAGSDVDKARTAATAVADGWILTGAKAFIANARTSDYILVLAVTDPAASLSSRFSAFLVDRGNPGLHFTDDAGQLGWRGADISAFTLEDCHVPSGHVLGDVGRGFPVMMSAINLSRLYVAARCVGTARECLRLARDYADERHAFGSRLSGHEAIQFMIADMDVELEAARLLTLAAAWHGETGSAEFRVATARAKLYATEMAGRAADAAMQILGGSGYTQAHPIERMYRDVRGFRLSDGTSEIQRMQIARHALTARGERQPTALPS